MSNVSVNNPQPSSLSDEHASPARAALSLGAIMAVIIALMAIQAPSADAARTAAAAGIDTVAVAFPSDLAD
jgi:hypothetical protein